MINLIQFVLVKLNLHCLNLIFKSSVNMFKINQSNNERVIRAIIGILLLIPFFMNASWFSYILLATGGILVFNAVTGVCMIYKIFGYSSCPLE